MSITREHETTPNGEGPPVLAEAIELIGEMEGSGYKEAPSIVRRGDGQVIQLPPLLYAVAARTDGQHTYEQIANEVADEIKRGVDADNVRFLVEEKLRPMGIVAAADGTSPEMEKPDPFLGFRFRAAVISESTSHRLGTIFKPLFLAPVVIAALAAFVAIDGWLFFTHGVAQSIRQSLYSPGLFLMLFAGVVASAAFHEIGHAAGCRYGGGEPGKMGCGLYLAWPAFYTDVTDAYRLNRRARLRTDLGGVYFNVIIVLLTTGAYALTHFEPLLVLVVIQHFEIVHQLLPIIRLDGYYIVADLTGVPDLFARIGPILRNLVPWRKPTQEVTVLKRWVRAAVTAWVLIVVPLLAFELLVLLVHLPRILATGWDSGVKQWHTAHKAFGGGSAFSGVVAIMQMLLLAIPILGIVLVLVRTGKQALASVWTHTSGRPVARALSMATLAVCAALLLRAWIPTKNYKPIRPNERGTITQGIAAVRRLPTSSEPLDSGIAGNPSLSEPATEAPPADDTTVTTEAPRTTPTTSANDVTETTLRRRSTTGGGGSTATTAPSYEAPVDGGATSDPSPADVPQ